MSQLRTEDITLVDNVSAALQGARRQADTLSDLCQERSWTERRRALRDIVGDLKTIERRLEELFS